MVKVTLEFQNVEETIVALGKLGGIVAAPAERAPRKGRNDKGQPREPYKPRATEPGATQGAIASAAPSTATLETAGASQPNGGTASAVTSSSAPVAAAVAPAPAPQVPVAASPSDVVKAEIKQQQAAQGTGFEPTVGEKDADVQKATEAVFGKFGIDRVKVLLADFGIARLRDLPKSKKADFLAAAQKIVA